MNFHHTLVAKPALALSKIFGPFTHFVITLVLFAYILAPYIFFFIPFKMVLGYVIPFYLIFLYRYALNHSNPKNAFVKMLSNGAAFAIEVFAAFALLGYIIFFNRSTSQITTIYYSVVLIFYLISTGFFSAGKNDIVVWLRRF